MDYYGLLDINRTADDLEIKKAFKRIALQLNRCLREDESTQEVFALVAEAYDVLSDPKRRAVYDQYGEVGLKKGVPSPEEYIQPYVYHGDFMRTYEYAFTDTPNGREFYGTRNPYGDLLDFYIKPLPLYKLKEGKGVKVKQEELVRPVYCTLEEIYQGCIKKMKVMRQETISAESGGQTKLREKILDVHIKPGMLQGTEIRFTEEGDQGPTIIPADIVFKLMDKPHDLFSRDGSNLVMKIHVTLLEALCGKIVTVKTPDYRTIRVPINDVIHPNYKKVVFEEGMPLVDDPSSKGDLIMFFHIDFPTYLPKASKNMIKKALDIAKMISIPGEPETINVQIVMDKLNRTLYDLSPAECAKIQLKPCPNH